MAMEETREMMQSYVGTASQEAKEVGAELLDTFGEQLCKRAMEHMKSRVSTVLDDSDMRSAYRDLTIRPNIGRIHRAIGDCAMILGGTLFTAGCVSSSWGSLIGLISGGIALIFVGIYIREFARMP